MKEGSAGNGVHRFFASSMKSLPLFGIPIIVDAGVSRTISRTKQNKNAKITRSKTVHTGKIQLFLGLVDCQIGPMFHIQLYLKLIRWWHLFSYFISWGLTIVSILISISNIQCNRGLKNDTNLKKYRNQIFKNGCKCCLIQGNFNVLNWKNCWKVSALENASIKLHILFSHFSGKEKVVFVFSDSISH